MAGLGFLSFYGPAVSCLSFSVGVMCLMKKSRRRRYVFFEAIAETNVHFWHTPAWAIRTVDLNPLAYGLNIIAQATSSLE